MNPADRLDLRGRRVTLIGLGRRTHVALARYLIRQGATVRVSERRGQDELADELELVRDLPLEFTLGGHRDADVADADLVFVTPGAPRDLPVLEAARRRGVPISSEIELLFAHCPAPIVGITGSAGKTTTTSLTGAMLARGDRPVYVGGNIGVPLIDQVDRISAASWVLLELSSFQLEALRQSPTIGAVLNVTPNHLDRHPTFDQYRESKFNLLRYQNPTGVAVLGADDREARALAPRCPGTVRWFSAREEVALGAFRRGPELILRDAVGELVVERVENLKLPGEHNVLNVLAASAIAGAAGIDPIAIGEVAASFPGVEHRLEFVRELGGIRYFDDSIATSPERTVAGLRSFLAPVVLIAGGRSKHLPVDELAREIVNRTRAVVVMGEIGDEISEAMRSADPARTVRLIRADALEQAVEEARREARSGDAIVLSPAGTSFDQFRDFEERGDRFKAIVRALPGARP